MENSRPFAPVLEQQSTGAFYALVSGENLERHGAPARAAWEIERLAALAARADGLMAVVDHPAIAERIDVALETAGATLDIVIDIDPGIRRTGVASAEAAVDLAREIAALPRLRYRGVQYYCG